MQEAPRTGAESPADPARHAVSRCRILGLDAIVCAGAGTGLAKGLFSGHRRGAIRLAPASGAAHPESFHRFGERARVDSVRPKSGKGSSLTVRATPTYYWNVKASAGGGIMLKVAVGAGPTGSGDSSDVSTTLTCPGP